MTPHRARPVDARAEAEAAVRLVLIDPRRALDSAEQIIARSPDPAAVAVALRAAGLALAETGELAAAAGRLRASSRFARRRDLPVEEADARISLAAVLAGRGLLAEALRELDDSRLGASGLSRARAMAQRGLVLARAGRHPAAMDCYRAALPILRRHNDLRFEALVLLNRGAARAEQGVLGPAASDLRRCAELARTAGLTQLVADAENNLGFVAALSGDVPAALAAFDRAETAPGVSAGQVAATRLDRARALLSTRLSADAAAEAAGALSVLDRLGRDLEAADARLLLAEAALQADDPAVALAAATEAAAALRRQRRAGWAARADQLGLRARLAAGDRSPGLTAALRRNVVLLDRLGWVHPAAHGRILLAGWLLESGRTAAAADLLRQAATARRNGSVELRTAAWHAEALRRLACRDRRGALTAARAGLRIVHEQPLPGELGAAAAAHGTELAALGLRITLDGGSPAAVLRWSERLRVNALLRPGARPPANHQLAARLSELRRVCAALDDAVGSGADPRPLASARARLEREIRDLSRRGAARRARPPHRGRRTGELGGLLGERALVSYVRCGPELHAITIVDGRCRRHDLGSGRVITDDLDRIRFAATLMARRGRPGPAAEAARAALEAAAGRLDRILCAPLGEAVGRDPIVVPTGELFALPWGVLPSWRNRPVVVAPSVGHWVRASRTRSRADTDGVLLAAGPGLTHAGAEIRALSRIHPGGTVLNAASATVGAVLAGIDGTGLAHLACHARFRADNPQFSCLDLADGPLSVPDLQQLRRPPQVLVLSACESGRFAVAAGDGLLGLAAALLGAGTTTLIAAVLPVPDAPTKRLMVDLHRRLRAGVAPAAALCAAEQTAGVPGFVCLGVG